MNKTGSTGIAAMMILISVMLVAVTAASIISNESEIPTKKDLNQIVNEVLDEITTYIQIKDKIGKYYKIEGEQKINKIAILIKPLITQDTDITDLTIKISNSNTVKILHYSGNAENIGSNPLFEHPIWGNITENNFGLIATLDRDRSLLDYDVINKDMAYIIIKLSAENSMRKGDSLTITLFPSSGITRTTTLEAPLPIKSVVSFE